jgi:TrmH family RNA methyltransferase
MPFRIVQSKQNARLKELRQALVHPGRNSRGLAGIEGPNLLEEALRAGLRIDCVFAAQGSEDLLDGLALPPETEIQLLPRELLDSALATETPQSIAALIETPIWSWADLLGDKMEPGARSSSRSFQEKKRQGWASNPLIVILAGLQDPGNLGTILRSAEAFGANGVLSLPGTVSAWNPKAVRASAGSVFRLPLLAVTTDECFARLRAAGVKIWTTAVQGAEAVHTADLAGETAILIGNEGNGVPTEVAEQADGALTIPCPGPVESLNASIAASILLYEASRQRAGSNSLAVELAVFGNPTEMGSICSHPSPKVRRMGHPDSVNVDPLVGGKR